MAYKPSCCNPFNIPAHESSTRRKNLRQVQPWMCEKAPIAIGSKICDSCRKKLSKQPLPVPAGNCSSSSSEAEEAIEFHESTAISSLNKCLEEIQATSYTKRKARQNDYTAQKVEQVTNLLQHTRVADDASEMLDQLKEKFHSTTEQREKLQILTVLPKSWSQKKIQQEFGVSKYMARRAKELVEEKRILATPGVKSGHGLLQDTIEDIKLFYESDDISRILPGKKDYVSVRKGDKREHIQKRLILCDLKEAYCEFKEKFPEKKVGFSKFAEMRPKHCVLAGSSGTHTVCVCTIHQNAKLMTREMGLSDFKTYQDCFDSVMCLSPTPQCFLSSCEACPGIEQFKRTIICLLDERDVEHVIYKQWVSTDRSTLETYCDSVDEFVDKFCINLEQLRSHSFIAKAQASFCSECKANLKSEEVLVTLDFSENYAFVLQDAAQGFHWNNSQATIHPFVAYYRESGELRHLSFVVISDCLHHNTAAVHLYQKCFIKFLRTKLPSHHLRKIVYFSDGATAQYKNRKNFLNLCYHKEDFGMLAEWHFFATAHGKGACDGLGGTVKRLAARASLQRPYNEQIMTPRQLYDWACINVPSSNFSFCTTKEYEEEKIYLQSRFEESKTIQGTRKLHSFVPLSNCTLRLRHYSTCPTFREEAILQTKDDLPDNIVGFVVCVFEGKWWLVCVLNVISDVDFKATFLHPHGPSLSFRYPPLEDIKAVPIKNILMMVDPRTVTGRTYTLSKEEHKAIEQKFSSL